MFPEVKKWLEERGFTLEMQTASAFRAAGFRVRQSSLYIDKETGKAREVDVLAISPDELRVVNIYFIVECKATKKPWVLLCSSDTLNNYNRFAAFAAMSDEASHTLIEHDIGELLKKWPWLRKDGLTGYSLREAFSDSADPAYAAAAAVAAACNDFLTAADERYRPFLIAFPVIVVSSPLLQASLGKDGDLQLAEVDEGEFLFFLGDFGTCIRVVTTRRLAAYTLEAKRVADELRVELKSEEQRVIESWKDRVK